MPRGQSGTVAHFTLERLREHGVERVYGYPGDGINGFLGALHESRLEFAQTRGGSCARRSRASCRSSPPSV